MIRGLPCGFIVCPISIFHSTSPNPLRTRKTLTRTVLNHKRQKPNLKFLKKPPNPYLEALEKPCKMRPVTHLAARLKPSEKDRFRNETSTTSKKNRNLINSALAPQRINPKPYSTIVIKLIIIIIMTIITIGSCLLSRRFSSISVRSQVLRPSEAQVFRSALQRRALRKTEKACAMQRML